VEDVHQTCLLAVEGTRAGPGAHQGFEGGAIVEVRRHGEFQSISDARGVEQAGAAGERSARARRIGASNQHASPGRGEQVHGVALQHAAAVLDQADARADVLHLAQMMAREHDRHPFLARQAREEREHFLHALGIEPGERFVEHQELRRTEQRTRHRGAPTLSVREPIAAIVLTVRKFHHFEHCVHPAATTQAAADARQLEVLTHAQCIVQPRRIERHADRLGQLGDARRIRAEDFAASAVARQQPEQAAHSGGFAGAVASEQTVEIACAYAEVESTQDRASAEADVETLGFENGGSTHADLRTTAHWPSSGSGALESNRAMQWSALTFDCFGTLVDWRRGTRAALDALPALSGWQERLGEIVAARERAEQEIQRGPFLPYREVLARSLEMACRSLGCPLPRAEAEQFADSQADWPVFTDTPAALQRLARLAPLGLLSNCDAAPLRACAEHSLRAPISLYVDAGRAGSYKPALGHWRVALEELRLPPERVLHISAYGFYDLEPAHRLGFGLAFVARDGERAPIGLPLAHRAADLAELADQLGA